MEDLRILLGVFGVAVAFAVWCIGPTVGGAGRRYKAPPQGKQGSKK